MKRLIILIAILALTSCKTHFTVVYAVEAKDRMYYFNHPQFDTVTKVVRGAELQRNGLIRGVYEIPFDSVVSITFNDHKYEWR